MESTFQSFKKQMFEGNMEIMILLAAFGAIIVGTIE
jgi:hypothetical protein